MKSILIFAFVVIGALIIASLIGIIASRIASRAMIAKWDDQ